MQEKWLHWKKHLKREETYLEPSGTSTMQLFFVKMAIFTKKLHRRYSTAF